MTRKSTFVIGVLGALVSAAVVIGAGPRLDPAPAGGRGQSAAGGPSGYVVNDSHFHLTNYVQPDPWHSARLDRISNLVHAAID